MFIVDVDPCNVGQRVIVTELTNPLGTRRCCDVESTSLTLNQRCNNVMCLEGWLHIGPTFIISIVCPANDTDIDSVTSIY